MRRLRRDILLWAGLVVVGAVALAVGVLANDDAPPDNEQGGDNVDYWLERATEADAGDAGDDTSDAAESADAGDGASADATDAAADEPDAPDAADEPGDDDGADGPADREGQPAAGDADVDEQPSMGDGQAEPPAWALPGVIELSDGTIIAGMLWTAGDGPLEVYVDSEKRWRRVPLAAALSITAVVVEERMENVWRWRATGDPQKVYTGEQYPFRRFEWTVKLADASEITGTIKGQAIHVAALAGPADSRILSERTKGDIGQALDDLVYARRIIISREAMEAVPPDPPSDAARTIE